MGERKKYQHAEVARQILTNALDYRWSLQGFGMLRFYITQELRLHIWDSRYRVDAVSGIHTHPWHFDSTVLCGRIEQYRYSCQPGYGSVVSGPHLSRAPNSVDYDQYLIRAGEGGGLEGLPAPVTLTPQWDYTNESGLEVVEAGGFYSQTADEIHFSMPWRGTVTIVQRRLADPHRPDHAFVYVPRGEEWISAEPRQATQEEVLDITSYALKEWFS